jgi:tetratricopeptide (TPR) repeat protein
VPRHAAILVLLAVTTPAVSQAQEPAPKVAAGGRKDREKKAESAFMAAHYQEAAELLNGLYAEFHNPVYLRNLGRCHQRLKDPDRAIAAFDEYLRRGKNIAPAEREEVQGFIREMEELKRQNEAAAAPSPPPPPVVATAMPPPLVPTAVMPPPPAMVTSTPEPARPGGSGRSSGKLVGGLLLGAAGLMAAGGGVLLASSWSEFHRGEREGCPIYYGCSAIAKRVEARALWGKILFGAAAATGIAGGTVFILSFSRESPHAGTGLTLAARGNF